MSIILKNNTASDVPVLDVGITVDASSSKDITYKSAEVIRKSDDLISLVGDQTLTINDGLEDLTIADAIRFITGSGTKLNTTTYHDGRPSFHFTPRKLGRMTAFMGKADNQDNEMNIGGSVGAARGYVKFVSSENDLGETPDLQFTPYGSTTQLDYFKLNPPLYIPLNTIVNKTDIHDAIVSWYGCTETVMISVEVVPETTDYISGTDTYYNLYGGYLIIPAAGDGTITVAAEDITLVGLPLKQDGTKDPGFWNADFNTTSGEFENITAAPYGDGEYNMFGVEVSLQEFVCEWPLIDKGTTKLFTYDSEELGHNMKFKYEFYTTGTHDWQFSSLLNLFREKTC
jgi:hypothetical protein